MHAPIPLRALRFISLDIFSYRTVEFDELEYDKALLVVCMPTGYAMSIPLRKDCSTARHCANALLSRWLEIFGVPTGMLTDRGPQFTADFWEALCDGLRVIHHKCLVGRHQGNGKCVVTGKILRGALEKSQTLTPEHNWV